MYDMSQSSTARGEKEDHDKVDAIDEENDNTTQSSSNNQIEDSSIKSPNMKIKLNNISSSNK